MHWYEDQLFWLKEFVDFDVSPQLADDLSMVGVVAGDWSRSSSDTILDLTSPRIDRLPESFWRRPRSSHALPEGLKRGDAASESAEAAGSQVSVTIESPQLCALPARVIAMLK
jgi:hypothetical protein